MPLKREIETKKKRSQSPWPVSFGIRTPPPHYLVHDHNNINVECKLCDSFLSNTERPVLYDVYPIDNITAQIVVGVASHLYMIPINVSLCVRKKRRRHPRRPDFVRCTFAVCVVCLLAIFWFIAEQVKKKPHITSSKTDITHNVSISFTLDVYVVLVCALPRLPSPLSLSPCYHHHPPKCENKSMVQSNRIKRMTDQPNLVLTVVKWKFVIFVFCSSRNKKNIVYAAKMVKLEKS